MLEAQVYQQGAFIHDFSEKVFGPRCSHAALHHMLAAMCDFSCGWNRKSRKTLEECRPPTRPTALCNVDENDKIMCVSRNDLDRL